MTTPQDDGGPAFPVAPTLNPDGTVWYHGKDGMSLRDWFAGMALQGLLAHIVGVESANGRASKYADRAYDYADAMLAARKEAR